MDAASNYLTAELLERRIVGWARVRHLALSVAGAFFGDLPASHDLVVTRIDNGAEVMRTPADLGSPEFLLDQVRDDLEQKTVEEFFAEWKLTAS